MGDNDGDRTTAIVGWVAGMAAGFVARKAIAYAWTRATGKEPPNDPQSPEVSLGEAIGWAVVTGVCIETAQILAVRAARRRLRQPSGEITS
ncbi:DUF4235 domain-containing protein [Spiractinospora alimapuensis]|uniref:DUF4235 domain-containing protein n=1 Tax=Spiractinospora alimapuensis TaxID=2820884 RepID=UPI001F2F5086|nr:DUF4235 domain-containing protein [Spiractinospora alimapuensis]QVQ52389.1 DUF4235 domain-containing protein [Spiractinospora alimapuensis]